jgi:signal transduction histidine kinase
MASNRLNKAMIRVTSKLLGLIERQTRAAIFTESLLFAIGIGMLDYASGYEVTMIVFYAIPILAVAWWCNRKSALVLATICVIIWWWADHLTGHFYSHEWVAVWEPIACFGYFGFVAIAGSSLKKQHAVVESRIALLEHSQRLEREIIEISEREQRRMGHDLHDGLCQYFAAVGCAAASLELDLTSAGMHEEAAVAGELTELLEQGVVQIRDLARGLVPVQMDQAGIAAALEQLAASVARLQNVACVFVQDGDAILRAPAVATHLYRIAQEAIHNAIRHGGAQRIQIHLRTMGNTATLRVIDDGSGISKTNQGSKGMGLNIMSYRARLVGGDLTISAPSTGGTMVSCTFPQTILAAKTNGEDA